MESFHNESPPPSTGSGAFDTSLSVAPQSASATCSDGSANDSTSGGIRSTGSIEKKTGALTLSQSSEGTTTAVSHYTGNPQTGECVDVGDGVLTVSTVKFTIETELPFTFTGSVAGTQTEKAHYSLIRTSAPTATIFDESNGLNPSVIGTLQPGEYEYRSSAAASNDLACSQNATETDDFNYSFKLSMSPDSDGDGLPDSWEEEGLDTNGDGEVDLNLPAMGADPERKDIFMEIDSMPGDEVSQAAVEMMVQAFANAPVSNPDGSTGITLHVDNGPNSVMDPTTGETWGALSGQNAIGSQAVLGSEPGGKYNWSAFETIKKANFEAARERAFHYVVSANRYGSSEQLSTGISRGFGGSDLIIAHPVGPYSTPMEEAGTLMHELGHNLGLQHGGTDGVNEKPTYLSVMNYAFQLTGLRRFAASTLLDYARFGLSINEASLDEEQGFGVQGGTPEASFVTLGHCPDGREVGWLLHVGHLDFNCDGSIGGLFGSTVASDINHDGKITTLTGVPDWPRLVYDGGGIGAAGDVALPTQTAEIEPPISKLREDQRAIEGFASGEPGPGPQPKPGAAPATPPRCTLKAKRERRGMLRASARCDQAATLTMSGVVKLRVRRKLGNPPQKKNLKLRTRHASVSAEAPLALTVKLPKEALIARRRGAKESIVLTLTAANADGTGRATARLRD